MSVLIRLDTPFIGDTPHPDNQDTCVCEIIPAKPENIFNALNAKVPVGRDFRVGLFRWIFSTAF
jgi:hypothetical protein